MTTSTQANGGGISAFMPLLALLLATGGIVQVAEATASPASRVCRPGPPLLPPTDGRKNCLVIGDSVSLGYTPLVLQLLNSSVCQVQHAPFSTDGGALDTKYAMQCFDQWMVTSMLQQTHYDAIVINSGLHDVNYSGSYPEEYTSPDAYKENFQQLKKRLLTHTPHVAVVTTTPVGYDAAINSLVVQYNDIAVSVMHGEQPSLDVIDLYTAVIDVCGKVPYNCSIEASPKNVHYNQAGYKILSQAVASGLKKLLSEAEAEHAGEREEQRRGWRPQGIPHAAATTGNVCPGGKMACPGNTTCTVDHYSSAGYGCCYAQPAPVQDCGDSWHCCAAGLKCGSCSLHGCDCLAP
ncbi:uncharacterized protein LOC135818052 [Sycon ciliatum]|uniref:uncharacterized protein LOC135818052 n=1 Tax=Sycon ciliatum TaxID=27933 RepID=UPI0031F67980